MRSLVQHLQSPARVAGAVQEIPTDRLLSVVDGLPNHIFRMDCKLYVQYTPHASNDDDGEELYNLIANLTIRDIASNVILKLTGADLRDVLHAVQGWRYADPADITGGGDQATDLVHFSIPFHGGPGGVQGYREFHDLWLPVDRIRGISIEVEWAATPGLDATIDDAKLYISCQCVPAPAVIVGADVRYSYLGGVPDAQQVEFPQTGLSFLYAGIHNTSDRDHSDYTVVNCPDFNLLNNVNVWQLLDAWNACLASNPGQFLDDPDGTPDFLPIIFQDKRYKALGAVTFPQGKARMDVTNTNGETQRLCMAQIHDTYELARQLAGTSSTVFAGRRQAKPQYEKKNRSSVAPRKANVLNRLLSYKLV